MHLTDQDEKIRAQALAFAREHKKDIAKRLTDPATFPPEEHPVSIFMAGSPGAGKTEASVELIDDVGGAFLRIDPDELRCEFDGYDGGNSWLFQPAVSVLVERILDTALKQKQSYLLDGTLTNHENDGSHRSYQANIDQIDNHVPEKYDPQTLQLLLGRLSAD